MARKTIEMRGFLLDYSIISGHHRDDPVICTIRLVQRSIRAMGVDESEFRRGKPIKVIIGPVDDPWLGEPPGGEG